MDDAVLIERSGPRLTITLNRPQTLNALTVEMIGRIHAGLDEAEQSDEIRVVVLAGAGTRGFCSGQDRNDPAPIEEKEEASHTISARIADFPKPVITLIFGHAIAAGARIALAGDIVVAAESLKLREGHALSRGGMPGLRNSPLQDDLYPTRLAQSAGRMAAKLFVLADEVITANQALALGMVSMVVPDDELAATGDRLAASVVTYPPRAVSYMLRLIDRATGG